jgi:hypothetical protein
MRHLVDDDAAFDRAAEDLEHLVRSSRLDREDVAERLEKAVHDGKLSADILGFFNTRPLDAVASIPHDICKSYGLPILSEPPRFPLEEIGLKIEEAIHARKLPPHFLGELRRNTSWVLSNIPEDVAKSYGIPRSL